MSPRPGPTFEIELAAPDIDVIKSNPLIDKSMAIIKNINKKLKIKIITELIKFSDIFWLLYFVIITLLGEISFFIWFFKNINNICSLKIFIPQAVEPAHPPININNKKKIRENFPHNPKSSVTYPVPDRIEITLKEEILILSNRLLSSFISKRYRNIMIIEIKSR